MNNNTRHRLKPSIILLNIFGLSLFTGYRTTLSKFIAPIKDYTIPWLIKLNALITKKLGYEVPQFTSLLKQLQENDALLILVVFITTKVLIKIVKWVFSEKDPVVRTLKQAKEQINFNNKWVSQGKVLQTISKLVLKEMKKFYKKRILEDKDGINHKVLKEHFILICETTPLVKEGLFLLGTTPDELYNQLHQKVVKYITEEIQD